MKIKCDFCGVKVRVDNVAVLIAPPISGKETKEYYLCSKCFNNIEANYIANVKL